MASTQRLIYGAIALFLVVAIAVVFVVAMQAKKKEGFIIFGELAPLDRPLTQCIDACQRQDPGTYLGTTGGSLFCEMACYDKTRDLLFAPPLKDYSSGKIIPKPNEGGQPVQSIAEAYELCGDGFDEKRCRSRTACQMEVESRCEKECLHIFPLDGAFFDGANTHTSDPKYKECVQDCSLVYEANCQNVSWGWKTM